MRDFSDRKTFPGTVGGPFELLVTAGNIIERIPRALFLLVLAILAAISSGFDWRRSLGMLLFLLGDWLLISLLPRFRISYGPPQPQVLVLALLRAPFGLLPGGWIWAAQAVGSMLVVEGFWVEPQDLRVRQYRLASPKLPPTTSLRILHFGDLHAERLRVIDLALVRAVEELRPDLILFSGDTLSYSSVDDPRSWQAAHQVFRRLRAPLGVFAVPGSPPVDPSYALKEVYAGTDVRLLRDGRTTVKKGGATIELVGLSCSHKPHVDAPRLESILASTASADFRLLLYHSPDLAPWAAQLGIDWQLSGHTHGGQVRLPLLGAIYASSLFGKRFEGGRYFLDGLTLYVTRGIGLEGKSAPRVRFLCRPEVALWELRSST